MPMLYLPCDCHNWDNPQTGPNVSPEVAADPARYVGSQQGQQLSWQKRSLRTISDYTYTKTGRCARERQMQSLAD